MFSDQMSPSSPVESGNVGADPYFPGQSRVYTSHVLLEYIPDIYTITITTIKTIHVILSTPYVMLISFLLIYSQVISRNLLSFTEHHVM